ncbi:Ms4533A family Cys-rich leader peptide [Mycobacterium sp. JS623]|uniref:Ms4533A family Cys-rich leader peptide n=1 Tax=Mycobacterium sp. JS623 TaxID=212767 RepID=UPI003FA5EADD
MEFGSCGACATKTRTRSKRDAAFTGDSGARHPRCPGAHHLAANSLTGLRPNLSALPDSVILRAMRTASGNKSGHILALIAVGFTAVADVCCCR